MNGSATEGPVSPGCGDSSVEGRMSGHCCDVIVIGAGVAGSLAAFLAARAGLSVTLVEKERFPRSKVCGGCLNEKAVRLLRNSGAGEAVSASQIRSLRDMVISLHGRTVRIPMAGSVVVARDRFDESLTQLAIRAGAAFLDGSTAEILCRPASGDLEPDHRIVLIRTKQSRTTAAAGPSGDVAERTLRGRVVLACDGLGHPSLRQLPEFRSLISPRSRIGVGIICPADKSDSLYTGPDLRMAVSEHGYMGSVMRHDGLLNLAAAIESSVIRSAPTLLHAVHGILHSSRLPLPAALQAELHEPGESSGVWIRGTPPLTRTSPVVASRRILLLGDSTGYIEPFTGEGMAWAIAAAIAVQPVIRSAVATGWNQDCESEWESRFSATVGQFQGICRLFARSLR
ncbi:MAG: FAD-dependent oxidoreductase, partial [Planctomycetaceae bacterium]|nr:FAD-dependent oxidoreductase [Planctomycetaceae bacterium]